MTMKDEAERSAERDGDDVARGFSKEDFAPVERAPRDRDTVEREYQHALSVARDMRMPMQERLAAHKFACELHDDFTKPAARLNAAAQPDPQSSIPVQDAEPKGRTGGAHPPTGAAQPEPQAGAEVRNYEHALAVAADDRMPMQERFDAAMFVVDQWRRDAGLAPAELADAGALDAMRAERDRLDHERAGEWMRCRELEGVRDALKAASDTLREERDAATRRADKLAERLKWCEAALDGLITGCVVEFDEKGAGGYALARLADARAALADSKSGGAS